MRYIILFIFLILNLNIFSDNEPININKNVLLSKSFVSDMKYYLVSYTYDPLIKYIGKNIVVEIDEKEYIFSGTQIYYILETIFTKYPLHMYYLQENNFNPNLFLITWDSTFEMKIPVKKYLYFLLDDDYKISRILIK